LDQNLGPAPHLLEARWWHEVRLGRQGQKVLQLQRLLPGAVLRNGELRQQHLGPWRWPFFMAKTTVEKMPGPNGVAKKKKKLPFPLSESPSIPTVSKPPNPGPHLLLLSHFGALPCNVQGLHQALGAEAPWRLHADAAHGAHGAHGRLARAAGPRGGHGGSIAGSPKQRQGFRAIPWF